jgi:hypothetical protein
MFIFWIVGIAIFISALDVRKNKRFGWIPYYKRDQVTDINSFVKIYSNLLFFQSLMFMILSVLIGLELIYNMYIFSSFIIVCLFVLVLTNIKFFKYYNRKGTSK